MHAYAEFASKGIMTEIFTSSSNETNPVLAIHAWVTNDEILVQNALLVHF